MTKIEAMAQYNTFKAKVYSSIEKTGTYEGRTRAEMDRFMDLALNTLLRMAKRDEKLNKIL